MKKEKEKKESKTWIRINNIAIENWKKKKEIKQTSYLQPTKRKSNTIHQNCTKKTEEDGKRKEKKKLTSKETFQFCL